MGLDGRTLVTKNTFRMLNTLYTMGPSPEPNLTILWSEKLPEAFKRFCAKVSIDTSSVQYENDDLMRPDFNSDDYAIACCVSPMVVGKQMQFFGARANLAKTMLYAINGGRDEKSGAQIGPKSEPILDEVLDYDKVMARMDEFMDWLATQYVTALNCIHFMHDKYAYEAALMALHDRDVFRTMACGIAGLSVAADSLSAIKYAKVKPVRGDIKDKDGNVVAENMALDFEIEGEYPQFGNNDPRVDEIACDLVERFMKKIQKHPTYRNAVPTQSVLTITSNVVYGKKTGNTPDGRQAGVDRKVTVILAQANKTALELRGEGDAQAAKLYTDAFSKYPDYFSFIRSMQAYQQAFKNHNNLMVVNPQKGDFFKYMQNPDADMAAAK